MEIDVEEVPEITGQKSYFEVDYDSTAACLETGASSAGASSEWGLSGPTSLEEVWDWAPATLRQFRAHPIGEQLLRNFVAAISGKLVVFTDFLVLDFQSLH